MHNSYHTLSLASGPSGVVQIGLSRPEAANALNIRMGNELTQAFAQAAEKGDCRAVVLTGYGRHFCAGADLKERRDMDEGQWHQQHHAFEQALLAILNCPCPVIAAVNGSAFGGGLELALAADFIYASRKARFGFPEVGLGIMPGLGGTQLLPRRIGAGRARELLFTGRHFSPDEALEYGLANAVFSPGSLLPAALKAAGRIAANAPLAVRAVKRAVAEGAALPLPDALECELSHYKGLLSSRDRHEGVNAFNEKRKPLFTGQ